MSEFICADCQSAKPIESQGGTGYASLADGSKICYQCCAVRDAELMRTDGRAVLYLSVDHDSLEDAGVSHEYNTRNGIHPRNYGWILTNWPGTLRLIPFRVRKGRHNIGRIRFDVWFTGPDGKAWHGVNIGDNQICRCKRLKKQ